MKRKKIILSSVLIIMLSLLVSGCWNRREMNDLAIAVGMGIDKAEDGQYEVLVQVVDPSEVSARKPSGNRAPVIVYSAKGGTVFQAIRRMTTFTPRKVYFSHLRMFVFGEALAREGISKPLDFLSRDQELRTDFYIVVGRGTTARDILNFYTPLDKIPANKMYQSLEVSDRMWAPTVSVRLDDLITDLTSYGKDAVLTGILIKGDSEEGKKKENVELIESPALLKYSGLGMFSGDRLVGWMNETESKGFSYLTDKLENTYIQLPCKSGGKAGVEVIRSKTKVKAKLNQERPSIDVSLRTEANIADVECNMDTNQQSTLRELEQTTGQIMVHNAKKALERAQAEGTDVFGFGEAVHRAYPSYWNRHKKEWPQLFKELQVNVQVDFNIRRTGTIGNSFLSDVKG
ncbi:Ger(x)C family spore germination protein [Paenibacillus alvei]|uniref:Ger(X)C family spore germination protein n=2 Tax=Paenibacillus TaxID=44249 RepID=A0AAP7DID8_PAEAL|nr:Ger(x)C family spore germination protein [Paenibacillus alvei]NOJ70509.1 Ger(x)C family spore germination protein [Paenibacillus alvei]